MDESNSESGFVVLNDNCKKLYEQLLVAANLIHSKCIRVAMDWFVKVHVDGEKTRGNSYEEDKMDSVALDRSSIINFLSEELLTDTKFSEFVTANSRSINHAMVDAILGLHSKLRTAIAKIAVTHFLAWMSTEAVRLGSGISQSHELVVRFRAYTKCIVGESL